MQSRYAVKKSSDIVQPYVKRGFGADIERLVALVGPNQQVGYTLTLPQCHDCFRQVGPVDKNLGAADIGQDETEALQFREKLDDPGRPLLTLLHEQTPNNEKQPRFLGRDR